LVISLRKKISELEDALRQARALQEAAEARCRELEAAAAEAAQRMAAMEKSLEQLRKEVKDAYRNSLVDKGSDGSEEEILKLKQQLKMSEEQRVKLEEMIAQLKKQLQQASASGDASAQLNAELQAARKRIEDLENRLKEAQKEIAALKKQKSPAPAKTEGKATVDGEAFRRLSAELEEERRKREELEELLQKAQEEIELLKKELDSERKKAAELSAELKRLLEQTQGKKPEVLQDVQQVTIPGSMTDEQLAELEELRAKAAELEKLKAKLKKRDAQIAALQEENDKLNEEQMRLLKMLKQVREQLRIVMELAEKKGLGDVIKKLFEEAGLGTTMSDPDYTCFDRLYDDALRRMDKQRRLEWYRLGNTGEPPPSFKAKQAYRRRESPERAQESKGRANHTGQIYCRNCGNAVEVPTNMTVPAPSLPATRSPSPQDRNSAYYRTQSTESLSSQKRSQSPQSRSLSPSAQQAVDLRIESVRPANNGQIALSVVTWGEPRAPSWKSFPGAAQTYPHGGARSRSPEKSEAPRRRGERGSLPPLQDVGLGQPRGVRMMGSSSATELRSHVRDEAHVGPGPGRLRGAMFVNSYRPFAADFTKEEPRMMWRPQKSFPLKDAPGLREHA